MFLKGNLKYQIVILKNVDYLPKNPKPKKITHILFLGNFSIKFFLDY